LIGPAVEPVERLRIRFAGRCGYCGVFDEDTGSTLTVDHRLHRAALVRSRARRRSQHALEVELQASRARVRALEAEIASLSAESVSAEVEIEDEGH
jgi:hypothetical protein